MNLPDLGMVQCRVDDQFTEIYLLAHCKSGYGEEPTRLLYYIACFTFKKILKVKIKVIRTDTDGTVRTRSVLLPALELEDYFSVKTVTR